MANPTQYQNPGYRALRQGRCSLRGQVYLVTIVTHQRIPWFREFEIAAAFCRCLVRTDCLGDAENLCYVVMPDHAHLLLQIEECPLQRVMNRLKSRSAVHLNRMIGRHGRFWAPGFHDHALRRQESLRDAARYVVANPLRAKLASRAGDYPFWNAVWL